MVIINNCRNNQYYYKSTIIDKIKKCKRQKMGKIEYFIIINKNKTNLHIKQEMSEIITHFLYKLAVISSLCQ